MLIKMLFTESYLLCMGCFVGESGRLWAIICVHGMYDDFIICDKYNPCKTNSTEHRIYILLLHVLLKRLKVKQQTKQKQNDVYERGTRHSRA